MNGEQEEHLGSDDPPILFWPVPSSPSRAEPEEPELLWEPPEDYRFQGWLYNEIVRPSYSESLKCVEISDADEEENDTVEEDDLECHEVLPPIGADGIDPLIPPTSAKQKQSDFYASELSRRIATWPIPSNFVFVGAVNQGMIRPSVQKGVLPFSFRELKK